MSTRIGTNMWSLEQSAKKNERTRHMAGLRFRCINETRETCIKMICDIINQLEISQE